MAPGFSVMTFIISGIRISICKLFRRVNFSFGKIRIIVVDFICWV